VQHPRLMYCRAGDRAVFLDIPADRYFCLPARLDVPFQRLVAGHFDADGGIIVALQDAGVVGDDGSVSATRCSGLPAADHSLPPAARAGGLVKAAFAQWRAQARLRRWSFARVIAHERRRGRASRSGGCDGAGEFASLHASFNTLAGWFGEADRCLARSLAFRALAFQRGFAPTLVLGVRLDPFAAHCWVQSGARVDNDAIERTRLYTPILTI